MSATPADHSFYFDPTEDEMKDAFDKLADDVKRSTIKTCARVAEIHLRTANPDIAIDEFVTEGYNQAVRDIAAKIRALR